jgi:hypothetical protein
MLQVSHIVANLEMQAQFREWPQVAGPVMIVGNSQDLLDLV